jgi:hypothetical protein
VGTESIQFLRPKVSALRKKQLVFEWKIVNALIAPFSSLFGIASFMAWRNSAGFPPFIQLESDAYARALTMPWDGFAAIIKFMVSPPPVSNPVVAWMNTVVFCGIVLLTIFTFRRIPWSWWFMQLGFLLFITTNLTVGYPLIGFFRYTVAVFPLFIEIAILGQRPGWRLAKFALGLILSILFSAMFFMWGYDL